jgi:AAA+ ATPase superfamily predicted ATPase
MGDQQAVADFIDSPVRRPVLGLLYGRRRIGKSTLLVRQVRERNGFYFEATRQETRAQLDRLGRELGEHLGVGRLALADWEEALRVLLQLKTDRPMPIVLDEFGHVLEADRSVESIIAAALGPGSRRSGQHRLILCGSAIAMMRALTAGEAPLRGRAGLELVMQPDDFRVAASRLDATADHATAAHLFAVIGGVVGYATDMVNDDLPVDVADFERWVVQRVLSASSTLHREASTLLAEDPTVAGPGSLLHHSTLAAIANGAVTAGSVARKVGKQVSNIAPVLKRLIEAGFVVRHEDPVRKQRPLYALTDPFLQFHYAVLEPHGPLLRERDPATTWETKLRQVFDARVRGPVFEEQARTWVRRFASAQTVEGDGRLGPSSVHRAGKDWQLDLVLASDEEDPASRTVLALGEAKAGETLDDRHLQKLELARDALGPRAREAKLLLFGPEASSSLAADAARRSDVELIDLERLYAGE